MKQNDIISKVIEQFEIPNSEDIGVIFDIQSYSVHDGPGCRTNIFFAGCPLHCRWCANPESWIMKKHLMFAKKSCKSESDCISCKESCPFGAISFDNNKKLHLDWEKCNSCENIECSEHCPSNALKSCGRFITVDELMYILKRDMNNWNSKGGVTFTGGEPLLQHNFLDKIIKYCKENMIHTAIESSGYAPMEIFMKIYTQIDFAFVDVKNYDDEKHIWGTGVSNIPILQNIKELTKSDWKGRLVLRTPIIAEYNDSYENAKKCIDFMKSNNLFEINLLKFHRMGATKWEQLGKKYEYENIGDVEDNKLLDLQNLYLKNDIACYIGDDTPF